MFFKKFGIWIVLFFLIAAGSFADYMMKSERERFANLHSLTETEDWRSLCFEMHRKSEELKFLVEFEAYFTEWDWEWRRKKFEESTAKFGLLDWPKKSRTIVDEIETYKSDNEEKRKQLSLALTGYVDSDWDELLEKVAEQYAQDANAAGLTISASRQDIESVRSREAARRLGLPDDVSNLSIMLANRTLYEYLMTQDEKPHIPMTGGSVERLMIKFEPLIEHSRLTEILDSGSFPNELGELLGHKNIDDMEMLRSKLELEDMPWEKFFPHISALLEQQFN